MCAVSMISCCFAIEGLSIRADFVFLCVGILQAGLKLPGSRRPPPWSPEGWDYRCVPSHSTKAEILMLVFSSMQNKPLEDIYDL